ncbi:hypothetical protein POTOM_013416 [Populus tomentosa]|uniref:Uncharacterized protein n=1 Tax=Populus tomentosa TaxID=118781 RepID=A0A8X8A2N5_POPTO|nr:hypothetical protein POTOM_013416 [Populus tomentosa]
MKKKGEGDKESERFAGKKETELRNEEVKSMERKENGYELEGDGGLSKNRPRRTDKKVVEKVFLYTLANGLPSQHMLAVHLLRSLDSKRMLDFAIDPFDTRCTWFRLSADNTFLSSNLCTLISLPNTLFCPTTNFLMEKSRMLFKLQ